MAAEISPATAFVVPGDPETKTGGFIYDRRVVEGLRAAGRRVDTIRLQDGFPCPAPDGLAGFAAALEGIEPATVTVVDGLAYGIAPDLAERHADRLRLVALVHHPLALETGLRDAERASLADSERKALRYATRVIATSRTTADLLTADFGVRPERLGVVTPGTDPAPQAVGSADATPTILCVATVTARKGHTVLLDALASLRDLPWRLNCAGSLERDPQTVEKVRRRVREHGLQDRVHLLGDVDGTKLESLYHQADLFALASHFEGFGMVLTEATARGLPIVATAGGAVATTVAPEASMLVPTGDSLALSEALRALLTDHSLRKRLQAGAREARLRLPNWADTASAFADQLRIAEAAPRV